MLARVVAGTHERCVGITGRVQRLSWPCKVIGELACSIAPFGYRPGLARVITGFGQPGRRIDAVVDYIQRQIIAEIQRAKRVLAAPQINRSPVLAAEGTNGGHHQTTAAVRIDIERAICAQVIIC